MTTIRIFVGCDPNPDKAYVYAIHVDSAVRYIGKGSGIPLKRAKEHMRTVRRVLRRRSYGEKVWTQAFHHRLLKAWQAGAKVEEIIVASGLSHEQAFALEVSEIKRLGSELWNGDKGGLGAGRITAETRAKQSDAAKRRSARPGERERLLEISKRADTPENRERARRAQIERSASDEYKVRARDEARRRWADPDKAERMRGGLSKGRSQSCPARSAARWRDPGARERQREAMRAAWARKRASA